MAPPTKINDDLAARVDKLIAEHRVVVFSKLDCPYCESVKQLLSSLGAAYESLDLDMLDEGKQIQEYLATKTGLKTVPNVFIRGRHIGGADATHKLHRAGGLVPLLFARDHGYQYDIVVVGGGSGGLAASKEAGRLGRRVAVCDFVQPTPKGTTWGLGGTCVNVGCIPKKLMHQAALLGQAIRDAPGFGWQLSGETATKKKEKMDEHELQQHQQQLHHSWQKLVQEVQNHIGSQNWAYKVALREKSVDYLNAYAEFADEHTLRCVDKKGKEKRITADKFILATGSRPRYPGIPGDRNLGITSDDLFSLSYSPGRTLLVGASYIALECAGFLAGLGLDVTVMVRSVLLREFDQQMAGLIGKYMEEHGVNFVMKCIPTGLEEVEPGTPGRIKVTGKYQDGKPYEDEFNTVVFAIGREACTANIGLDRIGVALSPEDRKVLHSPTEQTSRQHIFAIGDVLADKPELTPVAIQSGKLLARRLCDVSNQLTDYHNVCTTVFTPLEYGCCGMSEEEAVRQFGQQDVEVYHSNFWPLEWTLAHRPENACYCKLVCVKSLGERVVGFHYLGPNAGEVTQGYGLAIKMGATKANFDDVIGIHPTTAETFTTLEVTKASGEDPAAKGC